MCLLLSWGQLLNGKRSKLRIHLGAAGRCCGAGLLVSLNHALPVHALGAVIVQVVLHAASHKCS